METHMSGDKTSTSVGEKPPRSRMSNQVTVPPLLRWSRGVAGTSVWIYQEGGGGVPATPLPSRPSEKWRNRDLVTHPAPGRFFTFRCACFIFTHVSCHLPVTIKIFKFLHLEVPLSCYS